MTTQKRIDQFANRIAARLEGGGVPHDVSERLRIARQQALAALLAGLLALQPQQMRLPDPRVAEVDADLVADALPPKAYADPGFLQYLRLTQPPANVH